MQMISYWKNPKEIYMDDGLVLIIGRYDHKNENDGGDKALGVHWGDYPQSRGILSPCVIPETTRNAILSGLLHQAVSNNDATKMAGIIEAIKFWLNMDSREVGRSDKLGPSPTMLQPGLLVESDKKVVKDAEHSKLDR